jgi:2-methylisocitrate lyase-like PEP mutase family enzyme
MAASRPEKNRVRPHFRELMASGRTIPALGATDALSAKLIAAHGFECVYVGSYATAASRFALPDTGLLALPELVEQARTVVEAVELPVIADAEGGFQDAANLWRTVRAFEDAGVAAIHLEDHAGPGKHTNEPQALRPAREMAARIRAACEARRDPDFLVVARSDAFWLSRDLEDTIARLALYAEAGADLVFPTLVGPAELAAVRARVARPAMVVDMPGRTLAEHKDAAIVLFYGFSLLAQLAGVEKALADFKATGALPGGADGLERFLDYRGFAERSRRYKA